MSMITTHKLDQSLLSHSVQLLQCILALGRGKLIMCHTCWSKLAGMLASWCVAFAHTHLLHLPSTAPHGMWLCSLQTQIMPEFACRPRAVVVEN